MFTLTTTTTTTTTTTNHHNTRNHNHTNDNTESINSALRYVAGRPVLLQGGDGKGDAFEERLVAKASALADDQEQGKGQMGSAPLGSLQISCFFDYWDQH